MSTSPSTIEFILDQLSNLSEVRARKMFGEYALYHQAKVVALVCDDQLFVKITEPGKAFVAERYVEGSPYPGAKPAMLIAGDELDDAEWLVKLVKITASALPEPKPKRSKILHKSQKTKV
jgi:DNA transformation protein